ncbi:MAG: hypothetical protein PHS44_01920 [Candidatus Dojkabacteria bacterium]|jgi:hypothetical protein|nr:hypothetical protein [Candidatus Dojkabacteria bacterium]
MLESFEYQVLREVTEVGGSEYNPIYVTDKGMVKYPKRTSWMMRGLGLGEYSLSALEARAGHLKALLEYVGGAEVLGPHLIIPEVHIAVHPILDKSWITLRQDLARGVDLNTYFSIAYYQKYQLGRQVYRMWLDLQGSLKAKWSVFCDRVWNSSSELSQKIEMELARHLTNNPIAPDLSGTNVFIDDTGGEVIFQLVDF